jgi:arsenate reductase (glutaredoxin)
MKVTIYHNPRCSKSRATLQILQEHGIQPEIIEYLRTPPDRKTLTALLKLMKLEPRDIMRKAEPEYMAAGLDDEALTSAQLIDAMIDHPILIERPIVVVNGKAILGRPPERVLEIL